MIKKESSFLSFYNKVDIFLRNTQFPNQLTMDTNVTYNLYAHYATESQNIYGNIDHYVLNGIKACGSDVENLQPKTLRMCSHCASL